jgi:hypothetical protein
MGNSVYSPLPGTSNVTLWEDRANPPQYYNANLGPKTGFVYTGLCFVSLSYVYFCVGEVTGRTMEEINGFFADVRCQPLYSERNILIISRESQQSSGNISHRLQSVQLILMSRVMMKRKALEVCKLRRGCKFEVFDYYSVYYKKPSRGEDILHL